MPHEVFHSPDMDMDRSLGWLAADWIEHLCVRGNGPIIGEQVGSLVDDFVRFIVMTYAVDTMGFLLHRSSFLSRPKGCAKSELAAFIGLFDALGPSRFDHFAEEGEVYTCPWGTGYTYIFQEGEPVGKHMATPIVQCVATEEGQAGEVYSTIHLNCKEGPLHVVFPNPNDAGLTRINIPGGGYIKPISAKGDSKDGGKATLVLADETHLWKTNELHNLYATLGRNLQKRRKEGTFFLETSTMFGLGEGSVAEQAYEAVKTIREGRFKGRITQLFDHRYGQIDAEDLDDPEKVRAALIESYGDCLEWNDLESMVDMAMDLRSGADITATFRYFFNDAWGAINSWLASYQWNQCGPMAFDDDKESETYFPTPAPIQKGDVVTLGFDGSRKRERGVTDSTALIACRVKDGTVFPIEIWEQPPHWPKDKAWEAPVDEVQAMLKYAFATYRVVALYADPAYWVDTVRGWEAKYGPSLRIKASAKNPCEYWMTGGVAKRTVATIDKAEEAILNRELKHFDNPQLTTHVLNCRVKESTAGRQLGKETPNSSKKIDGAIAMILAWQARLDAIAAGLAVTKKRTAYRLR